MNTEYESYLQSDAWKEKRKQRLTISRFRCSACTDHKAIHVHHLTYARIFAEEMADLLPLCEKHHQVAEQLVKDGKISRSGDPLFLTTETLRLIAQEDRRCTYIRTVVEKSAHKAVRNHTQDSLLSNPLFADLLNNALSREHFKKELQRILPKGKSRNKVSTNAFALYDRLQRRKTHKALKVVQQQARQEKKIIRNGFTPLYRDPKTGKII